VSADTHSSTAVKSLPRTAKQMSGYYSVIVRLRVARLQCNHPQPHPPRSLTISRHAACRCLRMPPAPACHGFRTPASAPRPPVSCPPSPQALARHGEASPTQFAQPRAGPPADPGGQVTPSRGTAAMIVLRAACQAMRLAGGAPRPKAPSSLAAKRGSDDGGDPGNRDGCRKTFRVTGT
jgi:hypothetical protein